MGELNITNTHTQANFGWQRDIWLNSNSLWFCWFCQSFGWEHIIDALGCCEYYVIRSSEREWERVRDRENGTLKPANEFEPIPMPPMPSQFRSMWLNVYVCMCVWCGFIKCSMDGTNNIYTTQQLAIYTLWTCYWCAFATTAVATDAAAASLFTNRKVFLGNGFHFSACKLWRKFCDRLNYWHTSANWIYFHWIR